ATPDPAVDRLLAEAQTLGQQVLQEIRAVSYALHPPALDAGLAAALREYAKGFSNRSGVLGDLSGGRDVGRLSGEAGGVLLRVARGALASVARHAGTDRAALALSPGRGGVVLRVADRGRGMADPGLAGETAPLGVGIVGMRERLRQLGGELEIASN